MRRQLRGIALIIFGIMMLEGTGTLNNIFWSVDIPWGIFGVIIGIAGLVVAFLGDGK